MHPSQTRVHQNILLMLSEEFESIFGLNNGFDTYFGNNRGYHCTGTHLRDVVTPIQRFGPVLNHNELKSVYGKWKKSRPPQPAFYDGNQSKVVSSSVDKIGYCRAALTLRLPAPLRQYRHTDTGHRLQPCTSFVIAFESPDRTLNDDRTWTR